MGSSLGIYQRKGRCIYNCKESKASEKETQAIWHVVVQKIDSPRKCNPLQQSQSSSHQCEKGRHANDFKDDNNVVSPNSERKAA